MRVTDTSKGNTKNYWEEAFTEDEAGVYMDSYGQGPGYPTRHLISSLINDGETVLDVGCGPGWNFDHFMKYGPEIANYRGLDYSKLFVKVANKRVMARANTRSGPFKQGDARKLEEPDESWDVVILQDCLEHTNGYEKPVQEALRVAKKRVIISFWHLKNEVDPHINDDGGDTWGSWYDKRTWEEYLNSLPYVWHHMEIHPDNALHTWNFYILDKENS